jgi:hypothetical protein
MLNTTYVPNRIRIPTHIGNLGHHGLCMERETQESTMVPPAFYAHQSHQLIRHDLVVPLQLV